MADENPIRTLGDYSKPSHEGYRNTIELPVGNNVVPLRSDTIWLVQNGCSFHRLRSKDPNQHLKDFSKTSSNWLERLPAGSISTWEDLTTLFLAQFFPPRRTAKLRNDILMFQQHHGESLSEAWTHFKDLLQKVPHHGIDRWLQIQIFYDHARMKQEFVKPVQGQFLHPHGTDSKTPDQKKTSPGSSEDRINYLQKRGGELTTYIELKHTPLKLKSKLPIPEFPRTQTEPPLRTLFAFHERTSLSPQPKVLGTTFEARVRDYMAAHTKRIERFENSIFKQREEINGRMTEIFGLLKELTTSKTPEKTGTETPLTGVETKDEAENRPENKSIKTHENEEVVEAVGSQPIAYYLKHKINEKHIKESGCGSGRVESSTYMKLTDERPTETDIRLSLASHSNQEWDIEPIAPTMTVNGLVLEWEEKIRLHQEKKMEFNQWRSKNFKISTLLLLEKKKEWKTKEKSRKFHQEQKNPFSQNVETASRLTSDALTTTPATGSHKIPTASNAQVIFDEKKLGSS
ncbi:zinc finger, CCHC-type containing protein [Tanacetum coccineum]|uniref:Zinc finger, CCHC-type containing protein n=1 Tax=Tanacetum coccineum TaxID=301880 RepID=A0ABQ5EC51_9ASTR